MWNLKPKSSQKLWQPPPPSPPTFSRRLSPHTGVLGLARCPTLSRGWAKPGDGRRPLLASRGPGRRDSSRGSARPRWFEPPESERGEQRPGAAQRGRPGSRRAFIPGPQHGGFWAGRIGVAEPGGRASPGPAAQAGPASPTRASRDHVGAAGQGSGVRS